MKTLHVVPHSHLDREWYMPFEAHRYRLVELIDKLLPLMENNKFPYFHLDGQVIPIFDYLEIRPENKERLLKLIKNDQLQIGPWYILQDAYLTSAEANVRNMIIGLKLAKQLGAKPVLTGYFPDTFGNISQAPQILKGFNIKTAVFGRGLNEVTYGNTIAKQTDPSEVNWQSPDGSIVTAAMLSNWYCNAMDLPNDEEQIKIRFQDILEKTMAYSKIDHLLALNGCDHSPLQCNLLEIINKAQTIFPNVNIVFSNFKNYLDEVLKKKDKYSLIKGEINGQFTSGYGLLTSTSSSRIDIKQKNYEAQKLYEKEIEPLDAIKFLNTKVTNHDYLIYGWKEILKNHTHDAICACSIDEVHDEVISRFNKATQLGNTLKEELLDYLALNIKNNDDGIIVFNKTPFLLTEYVTSTLTFKNYENIETVSIYDENELVASTFIKNENVFKYHLPKDKFRETYHATDFIVSFIAKDIPPFGYKVFKVKTENKGIFENLNFNNGEIELLFNDNGTYNIHNLTNNQITNNLHYFEYTKDRGNEYEYKGTEDNFRFLTLDEKPLLEIIANDYNKSSMKVTYNLLLPLGINNQKLEPLKIETIITIYRHKEQIYHETTIYNKNHENFRLRAMFDTNVVTEHSYAEIQFDLSKRNITPHQNWINPSFLQKMQRFVLLNDETKGMILATKGLHEYEVLKPKNTLALTTLRAVGELGDWGYFGTPNSQMKQTLTTEYSFEVYEKKDEIKAIQNAYDFHIGKPVTKMIRKNSGNLPSIDSFISFSNLNFIIECFKVAEDQDGIIVRMFNIGDSIEENIVTLNQTFNKVNRVNLNEDFMESLVINHKKIVIKAKSKEIITIKLIK